MTEVGDRYDVVVIGGGPGGACTAALVAEGGRSVLLLEREPEPRFRIGESLMPAAWHSFSRLGVLDKMAAAPFPRKYSVQFFSGRGGASKPFYFRENNPHESSVTWQVVRREFDQMLLDNAAEKGAHVRRGANVRNVLFDGDRALGVQVRFDGGETREIGAEVVVDASGQSGLIARKLALRVNDPSLRNASIYTHYRGARRDSGIDEGATLTLHTEDQGSWFWFIPQPDDVVSVGVVGPVDQLITGRGSDPQQTFEEELARCPSLQPRLEGATQIRPVKVMRDFSYSSRRIAGDGWVLVGDAYGFLDPIYSSGVMLALKSGELAADAILDALDAGEPSAERLGRFEGYYARGLESLRQLVLAFYQPDFSFGSFLRHHPEFRQEIVELLIGNAFDQDSRPLFDALTEAFSVAKASS